MKSYAVYLGLGSNLGEREKYLNNALGELKKLQDVKVIWTSSVYETEPRGMTDQPSFLNAVVQVETSLKPDELFRKVKSIESGTGRKTSERWGPREIDIDILVYDGLVFDDDKLKVPHPEMEKRRFVLVPLREIAPDLVHPISGLTVEEMASACTDRGRVVKSHHRILL